MATMDYENENGRYDGKRPQSCLAGSSSNIHTESTFSEEPRYEQRDRSASPRPAKREDDYTDKRDDSYRARDRSHSPNGRVDSR